MAGEIRIWTIVPLGPSKTGPSKTKFVPKKRQSPPKKRTGR